MKSSSFHQEFQGKVEDLGLQKKFRQYHRCFAKQKTSEGHKGNVNKLALVYRLMEDINATNKEKLYDHEQLGARLKDSL